jgi:hypothetical protein
MWDDSVLQEITFLSVSQYVHWYIMLAVLKYILLVDAHASNLARTNIPDISMWCFSLICALALVLVFLF